MVSHPKTIARTLAALCLVASAGVGEAKAGSLIGTQVTGKLNLNGGTTNWYDPVNGAVPAGSLNTAGTTVTIADLPTEFGYQDPNVPSSILDSDFTANELIVTGNPGNKAFTLMFTDPAFGGISLISSSFTDLKYSISGDVITVTVPFDGSSDHSQAVFSISMFNPAPEPSTLTLTATAAAFGIAACVRRRLRAS